MLGLTIQEKQKINELRDDLLKANSQREVRIFANEIHRILDFGERRVEVMNRFSDKFSGPIKLRKRHKD